MLCSQEGKIGEPTVPREDQNSFIKGRDGLRRKRQQEKKGEKEILLEKKLISKVVVRRKKKLRGK